MFGISLAKLSLESENVQTVCDRVVPLSLGGVFGMISSIKVKGSQRAGGFCPSLYAKIQANIRVMSLAVVGCLVLYLGSRLIFMFMKMKSESGSQAEGAVGVRHTPLFFQKTSGESDWTRNHVWGV